MARKKASRSSSLQKAERVINVRLVTGADRYLDIGQELSKINRKLMSQQHVYGIESVEIDFASVDPAVADQIHIQAFVAPDNWISHNAYVKGRALWHQMNELVLDDNPSIQGKWADYKIFLDAAHRANYFANGNLAARDGNNVLYTAGEWAYSTYVLPEHNVDPATGNPLPADITQSHLLGVDVGVPGALTSVGLIKAYAESRATVFDNNPNVPAGMADSFFNLLTDSGSQEPELSGEIEFQNDDPPYDLINYPGGDTNAVNPVKVDFATATLGSPHAMLGPFVAPMGLVKFYVVPSLGGMPTTNFECNVRITIMAGSYKGVAAIPMGQ